MQVVWKASKELGIGKAVSKKNGKTCIYVVARYSPAGNNKRTFAENVVKGSFDKDSYCKEAKTEDRSKESSKNDDNDSFQQFHLDAHNKYRKVHSAPSMTLNSQMSKEAEEYAKKLAKMGDIEHSTKEERNGHGENLAMTCGSEDDLKDDFATKNW